MEKANIPNPNTQLNLLLRNYIPNTKPISGLYPEFEVRFGTKGAKITKIHYDNVVQLLLSKGYVPFEKIERLSIGTQFQSDEAGVRESSIRVEIHDIDLIQEYCRTNTINQLELKNRRIKFVEKQAIVDNNGVKLDNATFSDFNFVISYKNEKTYPIKNVLVEKMLEDWTNLKKTYRLISRIRFRTNEKDSAALIDMSVVRSSMSTFVNKKYENVFYYNIAESNVFSSPPTYEIEIELNNTKFGPQDTVPSVVALIHRTSKLILCGLQNTNFPISASEKTAVLANYSELLYGRAFPKLYPSNFIGPSSVTLQRHNLIPPTPQNKEPNILTTYAVTEKADGERHLLFIASNGGIYLINTSLEVLSTGTHTENPEQFDTLIDGELIKIDKHGKFVNKFVAFDIYYAKKKDYRNYPLMLSDPKAVSRIRLLNIFVSALVQVPNKGVGSSFVSVSAKTFLHSGDIFKDCRQILNATDDYEYNIDGLIFTHTTYGVGSEEQGKAGPKRLTTWKNSFKWKPSHYNTVDFLISTQKDTTNADIISSVFVEQVAVSYKTLQLKCGYSEKDHGFMNPVMDVIDKIKEKEMEEKDEMEAKDDKSYKAEQFVPYNPVIPSAGVCNVPLKSDGTTLRMWTIENDPIEDDTIVEFKFDKTMFDNGTPVQSCWIPIRNRYDKTAKYKSGENMFGNSYHTANSNWHSIHYAVSKEMICGEEPIPMSAVSADVYYNNSTKKSNTDGLRNFHNSFVKKTLIRSVSKPGDTLIDYGCGKAGDLPKWIDRKLSFVFGIDYSKDNIENRFDGAYARYLTNTKRYNNMPKALFIQGDCSKNIRDGSTTEDNLSKTIISSIFGQGNKRDFEAHDGIYEAFGVGTAGFNISSCQFAIHYFFKDVNTFHHFLRNVSECTEKGGYFIGTCYDGRDVMRELRKFSYDSGPKIYEGNQLICEIIKQYDNEEFEMNDSCLGKQILVYQDSINQYLPEYLVNFKFFERMMNMYGFSLLTNRELDQLNIPFASTGMFSDLFELMRRSPSAEYADGLKMTNSEKMVSFLNRYFIFKKMDVEINAETVANSFIQPAEVDKTLLPPVEAIQSPEETQVVVPLHRVIELKSGPPQEQVVEEVKEQPQVIPITTTKKPRTTKKVSIVEVPKEEVIIIEPPKEKRKYTKKVVDVPKEVIPIEPPKEKRKYTKKAK